ncbi:dihydrofolate reductase family protein [Jiella marina]|uniref:dihydrofolate reductase family protein n=1 Tax=Jiella sp. LLJ827 TaxID=2917712 RepID=UPI002100ABE0|nr:dihydrofolate reductase family protein [Jiella sp. LLJ827]MCQ0989008.1 dihydrofolate reductase family protein [Jiella sp. LLJ827]
MRKITAGLFQSLDGVVQAPGGPNEDESGGFAFGGWVVPFFSETTGAFIDAIFTPPFDLLLGRKTYDIFASHWPKISGDAFADSFNAAAKYVMTTSDAPLEWENSYKFADFDAIAALKQTDGPDLVVQGSSTLYPGLMEAGLIDRLYLITFPIILGTGKRALPGTAPAAFRMIDHRVSDNGVTIAVFEPSGEVGTGSFALPDEG